MRYSNYLANTTFRANSFGNVTSLGTSGRTTTAVLIGSSRAGAGSTNRIYSFLQANDPKVLQASLAKIQAIAKKNAYNLNQFNRNVAFNI